MTENLAIQRKRFYYNYKRRNSNNSLPPFFRPGIEKINLGKKYFIGPFSILLSSGCETYCNVPMKDFKKSIFTQTHNDGTSTIWQKNHFSRALFSSSSSSLWGLLLKIFVKGMVGIISQSFYFTCVVSCYTRTCEIFLTKFYSSTNKTLHTKRNVPIIFFIKALRAVC